MISMSTYTYNPAQLNDATVSRARFELGDTIVAGGAETAMLADEEIQAVIGAERKWKRALYRLADAVCMRLSYETDWQDDGAAFRLNQRAERWMKLRDDLKKGAETGAVTPASSAVADSMQLPDSGHYFYAGMMQSPYAEAGGDER